MTEAAAPSAGSMRGNNMHDYYRFSAEQLTQRAKTPVLCLGASEEVFKKMAMEMRDEIRNNNSIGRRTAFICPVGPVGQYEYFVRLINAEHISLKDVWFFNMDEYLTDDDRYIDINDPLSFRGFMDRNVYSRIDPALVMPAGQRVFPDPEDTEKQSRLLRELGGADICFGGIGITGHLAFNEPRAELSPEEFSALSVRRLSILPETRAVNSVGDLGGAMEEMPARAVTIGMAEILASRKIRLGVFRDWHRAVLRRAACGEITAAFPATLLQKHPDALIYANDVASARAVV